MKRHLLVFTAILLTASAAGATTLQETFDRTFNVRPGTLFALDNTNGHITVRSWNDSRVAVHALKKVESRDADSAKKAFDALKIQPTVTVDAVRIATNYPKSNGEGLLDWIAGTSVSMSVDYEITVPRSMNLQLADTNGGIDISDVRGSHRISTTNGHIALLRCAGDVDAETTNGSIKADLGEVNAGKSIRLETTNGRITIALPRSIAARVDASTTNGSIKSDLPVTTNNVGRNSLRGTINGGSTAELRLRTTNGSINIEAR